MLDSAGKRVAEQGTNHMYDSTNHMYDSCPFKKKIKFIQCHTFVTPETLGILCERLAQGRSPAMRRPGTNPRPADRKSSTLTTTPSSHFNNVNFWRTINKLKYYYVA